MARDDDAERLEAILRQGWLPQIIPAGDYIEWPFFERNSVADVVVVADANDTVFGYGVGSSPTFLPSNSHVMSVDGLGVEVSARGKGAGRLLLAALDDLARSRRCSRITLRVLGVNAVARALYESHGYHVEGILKGEFMLPVGPDGEIEAVDDVLMARDLPTAP